MGEGIGVLAVILFAAAALGDLGWRRIPNAICLGLAALGLARLAMTAPGWETALLELAVALAVLGAGAVLFHRGLAGGGDVKLLAAGALWLGLGGVAPFVMATALTGGGLAVLWIARRALVPSLGTQASELPYGVAISAGGILTTLGIV